MTEVENNDMSVYGHTRATFKGFGEYPNHDIKDRVDELMKACKDKYPTIDNYLLWLAAVDYVLQDELNIKPDDEKAKELYQNFLAERETVEYKSVVLKDENDKEIKPREVNSISIQGLSKLNI